MENDAPVVGPDAPTADSKMVKLDIATAHRNRPMSCLRVIQEQSESRHIDEVGTTRQFEMGDRQFVRPASWLRAHLPCSEWRVFRSQHAPEVRRLDIAAQLADFNAELGRRVAALDRGETIKLFQARSRLQAKSKERRNARS